MLPTISPFAAIIASLNSGDTSRSLARVILALQSLATPSPSTPLVVNKYPAYSGTGVKGFFDSFRLIPGETSTDYRVELPYSPKIWGKTLDLRQSIVKIPAPPNTFPAIKGFASPVALTTPPETLELFCYDLAVLLGANIIPRIEPLTGRAYLLITGTIYKTLPVLLDEETGLAGWLDSSSSYPVKQEIKEGFKMAAPS
jgi:hypothetical protein